MSDKDEFNKSAEGIVTALMIVGIVLGASYFFAGEKWQRAVLYSESWLVMVVAIIFSVLAIRKVEVERSAFVAVALFIGGSVEFYGFYAW